MTSNITLRLDEKTLNRVRHLAVDRQTSVSAWVSDLVTRTVNELDEFALARERALAFMSKPVDIADATPLTREQTHER